MRVEKGKVVKEKDERLNDIYLRKKLNEVLEEWFELKVKDIPEIMAKIGIKSKNYEIVLCEEKTSVRIVSLIVKTRKTTYMVDIFRGDMVNPMPYFKICHDGKENTYQVQRIIRVSNLS